MTAPKTCIYAIARNEEKQVEGFMACAQEADLVLVADTGSTDRTREALRDCGATVVDIEVNPWRFDTARNAAMALVPKDCEILFSIDLDERIEPAQGWSELVRAAWTEGANQLEYFYAWDHLQDGKPRTLFHYEKIHARAGFRWVHPVHEVLCASVLVVKKRCPITVHHWPSEKAFRNSYLPLLKQAAEEAPECDRTAHYYARELFFHRDYQTAIVESKRHLALPSAKWAPERAASMRYLGKCYAQLGNLDEAEKWYVQACSEAPFLREPWLDLAAHYQARDMFPEMYAAAYRALRITERSYSYLVTEDAWSYLPHDLIAVSAFYLGLKEEAAEHGELAARMNPHDPRLRRNVMFYTEDRSTGPLTEEEQRHGRLAREEANVPCVYPAAGYEGKGIVTCAGGVELFTNAWVMLKLLRHLGCNLPVELWHFGPGEMTQKMEALLAPLGVECRAADWVGDSLPRDQLKPRAWSFKPSAIHRSRFEEVLFLDADNFPVGDPELLFHCEPYADTGAVFWPDPANFNIRRILRILDLSDRNDQQIESGQILIDKRRCWRELLMTVYLNGNHDFFYQYVHGDKDTWYLAWRLTGRRYSMPPYKHRGAENGHVYKQYDFDGNLLFQHRVATGKLSYERDVELESSFAHRDFCVDALAELRKLWDGRVE